MISGLSIDGKAFFYENPLEINMSNYSRFSSTKDPGVRYAMTQRQSVFECSCCPPNLNRVLASIGDYLYGYENDCVYVNQFADSTAEFSGMKIEKKTEYPKDGKIEIELGIDTPENFKILLRNPIWSKNTKVMLNNDNLRVNDGYIEIENEWKKADKITIIFEMKTEVIFPIRIFAFSHRLKHY